MKLYDSRRAPNPRRVRWFMAEKGIEDVEIVDIDIFGGQHRQPDGERAEHAISRHQAVDSASQR